MMRLRWQVRWNKVSGCGTPAVGFGFRVGYWPCLHAPYFQLAFAFWRFDVWYGLPTYRGAIA